MALPPDNVLYKIFGITNIFGRARNKRVRAVNYIYRLCFLLLLLYTPMEAVKLQLDAVLNGNIILSTKVLVEGVTYWLTLYLSYVYLLYKDGKIEKLKSSLYHVEKIFSLSKRQRRRQVIGNWLAILILLTCQVSYYTLGTVLSGGTVIISISYFLNKFTVNLINYQFCQWLWVTCNLYREMNERLRAIGTSLRKGTQLVTKKSRISLQRMIYDIRYYQNVVTQVNRSFDDSYSVPILFVVVNGVVEMVCSLTGLIFVKESCSNNYNCMYEHAFHSILWFSNFYVPILLMVFSCSWVMDEVNKTPSLVLDIEMEVGDELSSLLEAFLMELRLSRFAFTGFRCFIVDKTLLLTNGSTAITYLIIQKQFAFDGFYASYTGF